ncbi:MAG: PUA domain-containing protein [Nitrososphaerota archaeon]|nr:PUA domain-containing protein [Nitrososphaerota archaeon]
MDDLGLLETIRLIADYQFGFNVGLHLFPDGTIIQVSKKTGRPRYVLLGDKLLATVRSADGMLALTLHGGARLSEIVDWPRFRIVVKDAYLDRVLEMKIVRAEWISHLDEDLVPYDEILVCDSSKRLIGVGRITLSGKTISSACRGTAVKIREVSKDGKL